MDSDGWEYEAGWDGTYYEVGTDDTLQKIVARMCPDQIVTSIWNLPAYQGMYNYENV